MTGDEIREAFLSFFESKGHLRIPSSSLIPAGDPTLLLTNAGMVQLKPYFTGEMQPPGRRLTSSQKCFRTTDVGQVGDATHLTFFEMLGNFSVGDYFKEDAIRFAWEFVTERLGLEPDRIWASVFRDDDEAFHLWTTRTGVPAERIRRFDEQDNFWGPAGSEGPCGPCSEIHYDFGADRGCLRPDCGPNCENMLPSTGQTCDRFIEMWNLVFMQFYQDAAGERTPLPAPNIDTGMGLERAAVILQGKRSIYETDLFDPLVRSAAELCGRPYGRTPTTTTRCEWWPNMLAARPSSSATEWFPATAAGTTCSAASCAGPSDSAGSWASKMRSSRRSRRSSSTGWARPIRTCWRGGSSSCA